MKIFVINENHYVVGVCREGTLGLFPYDYDSAAKICEKLCHFKKNAFLCEIAT